MPAIGLPDLTQSTTTHCNFLSRYRTYFLTQPNQLTINMNQPMGLPNQWPSLMTSICEFECVRAEHSQEMGHARTCRLHLNKLDLGSPILFLVVYQPVLLVL